MKQSCKKALAQIDEKMYAKEYEDEYEEECDAILKQMVVHEQYIDLLL